MSAFSLSLSSRLCVVAICVLGIFPVAGSAKTILVSSTIGEALTIATSGDTVLVPCGVYNEVGLKLGADIVLRGETGLADCVTIDAQEQGRILDMRGSGSAVVEGITFTRGRMCCICRVRGCVLGGAAMLIAQASPLIKNCVFSMNVAAFGGAIFSLCSTPRFEDCVFTGNEAIFSEVSPPRCEAAEADLGGDILPTSSDNLGWGGALHALGGSDVSFLRCVFTKNEADAGAAVCAPERVGSVRFTSCTLVGNRGESIIGVSVLAVQNSLIAFNSFFSAPATQGPIHCNPPFLEFSCNNVFGNTVGDYIRCLTGLEGVNGNFSLDPLLCNTASGDLRLAENSPCLPENNPTGAGCALIGALGAGCGPVAIHKTQWGQIKHLYR